MQSGGKQEVKEASGSWENIESSNIQRNEMMFYKSLSFWIIHIKKI